MTTGDASAEDSFASFYEREFQLQVRRASLIAGSSSVAEDIAHDAFVEVWRRWSSLDDPGKYLNRCVINGARTRNRQRKRGSQLVERIRHNRVEQSDQADVLSDILQQLSIEQRAVIVLRYYGGLSDAEIAEALNCPVGSIGPWIHRSLKRLRKALS